MLLFKILNYIPELVIVKISKLEVLPNLLELNKISPLLSDKLGN